MALYTADQCKRAVSADFYTVSITNPASELTAAFPSMRMFSVNYSPLSPRFVRDLCTSFGPKLTVLTLVDCNLYELPRELGLLVNLNQLCVSQNDIHWVHHGLSSSLGRLHTFLSGMNRRLPDCATLADLCRLDAKMRATQLYWMTLMRKRRRVGRDVVRLLGQALWALKGQLEHELE
jgi:hypothetical protein